MDHGHEMMMRRRSTTGHEAALRSVPWRAGNGLAPEPTPPRVYRVEPQEFGELVQRLTGAPSARQPTQPVAVRAVGGDTVAGHMYATWCPFPLTAPAEGMHPGHDGHHLL